MGVLTYNCKTKQTTYREYTEEELLEMQKAHEESEKAEAMQPPTTEEILEIIMGEME